MVATAFDAVEAALDPDVAVQRLRSYFDPGGRYAGATFTDLLAGPDTAPNDFTATDLFAVTLLSVAPPKPRPTRRFLNPGEHRNELLRALAGLDDANDIAMASDDNLLAMKHLYLTVRGTLGKSPWVTGSKLCVRKRPDVFPVRDNLTSELMGLRQYDNYQLDWQVFRLFMLPESGIPHALTSCAVPQRTVSTASRLQWTLTLFGGSMHCCGGMPEWCCNLSGCLVTGADKSRRTWGLAPVQLTLCLR